CGHNGFPETNPEPVNHVRLKLVESGEVIARQIPPRNDTATKTTWDLKQWAGQQGILEVVDADTGDAYAWLAVSRFEPAVVAPPAPDFTTADHQLVLAVNLVEQLKIAPLFPRVVALLADRNTGMAVRGAAISAAAAADSGPARDTLEKLVVDPTEAVGL